jgi:hypothetical protein
MIHIDIISGAKIETHYLNPPIPYRAFDYVAFRDPESTTLGYGPTREAAIADLLEQEDDEAAETIECECCAGTGITLHRTSGSMSYVGPGPAADDARKVFETTCDECRGKGVL